MKWLKTIRAAGAVLTVSTVLGIAVPTSAVAKTAVAPTLSVTPNTGLVNEQTVVIEGSGFPTGDLPRTVTGQCRDTVNPMDLASVNVNCNFIFSPDNVPQFDEAGNLLPFTGQVRERIFISGGKPFDCTVNDDCSIVIGRLGPLDASSYFGLEAPISFRPAEQPLTADDCKKNAWRSVVDDRGEPFSNQGQCVAFVKRRR